MHSSGKASKRNKRNKRRTIALAQTNDSIEFGPESDIERGDRFEKALEYVRANAWPLIERISEDLKLPANDVVALAIAYFSSYLRLTQDENTFVLVVKGTVTPYDSALEALLASTHDEHLKPVLDYLKSQYSSAPGGDL
jgi:hypothetical protein